MEAYTRRREDEVELIMAGAFQGAALMTLGFHEPKRFPRKFDDWFKQGRKAPRREQSDAELWAAFEQFATQGGTPE